MSVYVFDRKKYPPLSIQQKNIGLRRQPIFYRSKNNLYTETNIKELTDKYLYFQLLSFCSQSFLIFLHQTNLLLSVRQVRRAFRVLFYLFHAFCAIHLRHR